MAKLPAITHIVIWQPPAEHCYFCDAPTDRSKGIPVYEGEPVPADWEGEWCGVSACDECFAKYEAGEEVGHG